MSFDPDIYDITQPGSCRGDLEWYLRKAVESGGPVLELGAGTGRITIPIAEAGVDITGLELNPAMLQRLQRKVDGLPEPVRSRVSLSLGDMKSFSLDETFALVIIPFHSFLHNLTTDDQVACLRRIHDHLRPGGELAFNVNYPSLDYMSQHAGPLAGAWRWSGTRDLPDGRYIVYAQALRWDTIRQRVRPMIRTEFYNADGELERTKMLRLELAYLYPEDVRRLLCAANLELIRISADFGDRPLQNNSDEMVIEARRRP